MDWRDEWAYCGTLTGDILKAKLNFPEDDRLHELERPPLVSLALGKVPKKKNNISETDNYSKGIISKICSLMILFRKSIQWNGHKHGAKRNR